jgi:hypothetical protein
MISTLWCDMQQDGASDNPRAILLIPDAPATALWRVFRDRFAEDVMQLESLRSELAAAERERDDLARLCEAAGVPTGNPPLGGNPRPLSGLVSTETPDGTSVGATNPLRRIRQSPSQRSNQRTTYSQRIATTSTAVGRTAAPVMPVVAPSTSASDAT